MTLPLADALKGRLIVSCQAPPGDPMRHTDTLVRMTLAAQAAARRPYASTPRRSSPPPSRPWTCR